MVSSLFAIKLNVLHGVWVLLVSFRGKYCYLRCLWYAQRHEGYKCACETADRMWPVLDLTWEVKTEEGH